MAECLTGYGALAVRQGDPKLAVVLLSASISLTGAPGVSIYPSIQDMYERYRSLARNRLAEVTFAAAQQDGSRLSIEGAFALIQKQSMHLESTEDSVIRRQDRLTPRQREVATLIGQGKSNPQIADVLVLSKRTVEKHVANILAALELENRAEIIRWAIENRLVDSAS